MPPASTEARSRVALLVATLAMAGCTHRSRSGHADVAFIRRRDPAIAGDSRAPRPLAPASLAVVTSRRPTFRWVLAPGTDGGRVEVCRDRACITPVATLDGATEATPSTDLPSGELFWRTFARRGAAVTSDAGVTWTLWVGGAAAPREVFAHDRIDIDGDGYADLVDSHGSGPSDEPMLPGEVRVFFGGPRGLATRPQRIFESLAVRAPERLLVARAGDVNRDGYGDVLVSAPYGAENVPAHRGRVSVYLGGPNGLATAPQRVLLAAPPNYLFGSAIASAGDVDGDGYADVLVGAPSANPGGVPVAGMVSVFHGGPDGLAAQPREVFSGSVPHDQVGSEVASAGDVNGDGYGDVLVGVAYADPGGRLMAGVVHVFAGGPNGLAAVPNQTFEGATVMAWFGHGVAGVGDVNDDGYADVRIMAFQREATDGGERLFDREYVYLGGARGLGTTPSRVHDEPVARR